MVARNAESGGAPKAAAVKVASPAGAVEELLQILQRDLLEEGPPCCIISPEGEMVFANKAYHRIAEALAQAGALPNQTTLGLMPQSGDLSPIAVSQEHKLTIDGRTEYYRARRRLIRGADGATRATALVYESTTKLKATATALVQATTRLDDTTRLVSDWVWETDRSLVLTFVSPRVHDALGYHPR